MREVLTNNPNTDYISLLIQDAKDRPDDYPCNGVQDYTHDLRTIAASMLADTRLGIEIVPYGNTIRVTVQHNLVGEIEDIPDINTVDALMTILKTHYAPDHLRGDFHKTVTNRLLRQTHLPQITRTDITSLESEEHAIEMDYLPDYLTQPHRLLNALFVRVEQTENIPEIWNRIISPDILKKEPVIAFRLYQYAYYNSFDTIISDGVIGQVKITRALLFSIIERLDRTNPIYSPDIPTALHAAQYILRSKNFMHMMFELTQIPNGHLIPGIQHPLLPDNRWQYFTSSLRISDGDIAFTDQYREELDRNIKTHNNRSGTLPDTLRNKPYTVLEAATTSGCPLGHGAPSKQTFSDDRNNIAFFPDKALTSVNKHPIISLNDTLIDLIDMVITDKELQQSLLAS